MPNDDLKEAVSSSFLSEDRKLVVLRQLETEGVTAQFWNALRQELIAEIEKRGRVVKDEMSRFDEELLKLDADTHEKSERALSAMTAQMENVAPSDMALKSRLWEGYYQAQEQAQLEYEKALKAKISDMTMRLMNAE